MAPKAPKAPKAPAPRKESGNKNWEAALTSERFEEDSWKVCVSLVVEKCPEDEKLILALVSAVQKPQRKLFSLVTWDDTRAKIHEFGNPKNKKHESVPKFSEVTEPAKVLLDNGEEIPVDLLAKLVKFQLLQIKNKDKERRQAERVKSAEEKVKEIPPSAKDKGGGKDKKGKAPSPVLEKKTKLKRRDEVDPPDYIDDEPDDGPQHYVLIVGFYNPQMFLALDSIGVHVSNIIELSPKTKAQQNTERKKETENDTDTEYKERMMKLAAQTRNLSHFWSSLCSHLDREPPDSKLHDVVLLKYSVGLPTVNVQEPEALLTLGSSIFEGIACLIYDSLDWRRQHQHYLNKLKVFDVPTLSAPCSQPVEPVTSTSILPPKKKPVQEEENLPIQEPKTLTTDVDMCHYNILLDTVPPEACSVPLVLHCMLEQVVLTSNLSVLGPSDETEPSTEGSVSFLDSQLAGCMLQQFLPLVHTESEKSRLLNSLIAMVATKEEKMSLLQKYRHYEENSTDPQVFRHHDERAIRLRNCKPVEDFSPLEVEKNMLMLSPVHDLLQSVALWKNASCWMVTKQQLQHYCTNDVVSWLEVERLFAQSVFESMPLTQLDHKGVLLKPAEPLDSLASAPVTTAALPWDDPLSFAKQQLQRLQKQGPAFLTEDPTNTEVDKEVPIHLELSEIQSCRHRSLFDWHYTEHHNAATFPQVLQEASENYRCLDTLRGRSKNILYIYCHNPMSDSRQCKESWEVALHTSVKFRKYLENVADKISDWTKEEESKREGANKVPVVLVETVKVEEKTPNPIEKPHEPVIRKESLKAWKLEQDQLKEDELTKKAKKETAPKAKPAKEDIPDKDKKPAKDKNQAKEDIPDKDKKTAKDKKAKEDIPDKDKKPAKEDIPDKDKKEDNAPNAKKSRENTANSVKMDVNKETEQTEEEFNGFIGYNMDGKLIHVSGHLHHLYPSDGGRIIVETACYVEGSSLMKVVVKKDGHSFYTHVNHVKDLNTAPKPVQPSAPDIPKKETHGAVKVKQGSLTAVLHNGIRLSYSFYGPTGQHAENSQEPASENPETSTNNINHNLEETQPELQNMPQNPSSPTEPAVAQEVESGLVLPSRPFNSLSLCLPNGLLLQLMLQDSQGVPSEGPGMLVRQSFPLHGEGSTDIPDLSLSEEVSRLVTSQGAVVRTMKDGSTEVLFADGSVSFSQDSGPVWPPASVPDNTSQDPTDDTKEQSPAHNEKTDGGFWSTTTPSGARISTVGTSHEILTAPPVLVFKATDPISKEVMLTREDRVVSIQSPDGSITVEHADGTRITSLFEDSLPIHGSGSQQSQQNIIERPDSTTLKSSSAECQLSLDDNSSEDTCTAYLEIGNKERTSTAIYENSNASLSDSRKSSTSENESVPMKEKVVLVEKEGCATVVLYPHRHMAHVFLADGTVITGNNKAAYQVFPSSSGLLQIHSDGKCMYTSKPLDTPRPGGGAAMNQRGTYTMSHCEGVACDVTDQDGNHFQVMEDGTVSVVNARSSSSKLVKEDEEDGELATSEQRYKRSPRLFIAHENGCGTELLHSQSVEELLFHAYSDPTVAVMKEPLPDTEDEFGITILRPRHESTWSQWLLAKQKADITPLHLRNRSWTDFPRAEKQTAGPPFGTEIGRSLSLFPVCEGSVSQNLPLRTCPKALEMRELQQHRPFTSPLRNTLDTQLKEYIKSLMEKQQRSEKMRIKEPRSEKESGRASDLLNLVLSFAEEEDSSRRTEKQISDISSLYMQGTEGPVECDTSEATSSPASESFTIGNDSQWTERLALYRQELCEEKACRDALRKKRVVPYFHIENLPLYESILHQEISDNSDQVSPVSEKPEVERIPTPKLMISRTSPLPRPTVLKAAAKSPTDPPHQTAAENNMKTPYVQCKYVNVDVIGQPRKSKVKLPICIKTTKPSCVPNHQFLSVEDPVRRRCRTTSLTNPDFIVRGFHLIPPRVSFGPVVQGSTSSVTVVMRNVGVDTCRFNIKQPPPSTGLRVIYNPGPVAAGLQVELQIQLLAMCLVQIGESDARKSLYEDITIHTETDIIYLPVTATILTPRLYNQHIRASKASKLSNSVKPPTQPDLNTRPNL